MASLKSMRNLATAEQALLLPEVSFSIKMLMWVLSAVLTSSMFLGLACTAAADLQQPAEAHLYRWTCEGLLEPLAYHSCDQTEQTTSSS